MAHWDQALAICSSYGMELMSIETKEEEDNFNTICNPQLHLFGQYNHIGGLTTVGGTKDDWYWIHSGEKIQFPLAWPPGEPNFANSQKCLALHKTTGRFMYNDIDCYGRHQEKFVCQAKVSKIQPRLGPNY